MRNNYYKIILNGTSTKYQYKYPVYVKSSNEDNAVKEMISSGLYEREQDLEHIDNIVKIPKRVYKKEKNYFGYCVENNAILNELQRTIIKDPLLDTVVENLKCISYLPSAGYKAWLFRYKGTYVILYDMMWVSKVITQKCTLITE